jgi:hypothetical protein
MTRRFLDNVRSDINTQIVTNANGDITAVVLAPLMIDTIDSCVIDQSRLIKNVPEAAVALTTVYTQPIIYNESEGGDATFLKVNLGAGSITTNVTEGFTYNVEMFISFIGINNTRYDASFLVNGVPTGITVSTIRSGADEQSLLTLTGTALSAASNSTVTIGLKADVAGDIEILAAVLRVDIAPTNNP